MSTLAYKLAPLELSSSIYDQILTRLTKRTYYHKVTILHLMITTVNLGSLAQREVGMTMVGFNPTMVEVRGL